MLITYIKHFLLRNKIIQTFSKKEIIYDWIFTKSFTEAFFHSAFHYPSLHQFLSGSIEKNNEKRIPFFIFMIILSQLIMYSII